MTNEDFLLLADHVLAGPVDEVAISYEGKLPRGVASRVETALRRHAITALFVQADVQPIDTTEQADAKRAAARAVNARTLQVLLAVV
jgi:hypothetical protein